MTGGPVLVVSTTDPTPPYEQLRRQLAEAVRAGALPPGTRLPPLRQLAADLGLAVGTVARAYRELEDAGLVRSRRGAGTRVVDAPPGAGLPPDLLGRAGAFVRGARGLGASPAEILAAVEHVLGTGAPPDG